MRNRLLICNDDGIQMVHACAPDRAEPCVREWVDFFLVDCGVDLFAFCTARPDKTHHETRVGERDFSILELAPSQSQLHYKLILDELRDAGTDILHVVCDQTRRRGRRVLASVRMSDVHHASEIYSFLTPQIMRDHPEWRLRHADGSPDVALDYVHQGVRDHRLAILAELASDYDLDGIELDFMRSCRYFAPGQGEAHNAVMNDFISQVRAMLDRVAAERGRAPFLLGMRVPPSLAECAPLGLDPQTWVASGWADYLAPSDFMWLDYATRVEEYAGFCEGTACGVYPCLNPFAAEWVDHRAVNAYTPNPVNFNRRVFFTDEQIRGALRNSDTWGGDGIYAFNFCCETIDNPEFVSRALAVAGESPETRAAGRATYTFLPIWRADRSPSGGEPPRRALRFGRQDLGRSLPFPFRVADGRDGAPVSGRLRFRVYNLYDDDRLALDLNHQPIPDSAIVERRKTNIHLAADRRYPGMHIPPHIAYEIDLSACPPLCGDNELAFRLLERDARIDSDCMVEAIEVDIGWNGSPQSVGYLL